MTFGITHADNFQKAYLNFLYYHLINEILIMRPEYLMDDHGINFAQENLKVTRFITQGWQK